MSASVQTNVAAGYLSSFELPIGVSMISKLSSWPNLQELGFAGSLGHQSSTFHGLSDFKLQMAQYSSTSGLLAIAWNLIKNFVINNAEVELMMFTDSSLGKVGKQFSSLGNFGQVFALSPSDLGSVVATANKVKALS